jgi:hypothetical protein
VTDDIDKHPLPRFELLEQRYTISRVLGVLPAATCLKAIFRGGPPNVDPLHVPSDRPAPIPWFET